MNEDHVWLGIAAAILIGLLVWLCAGVCGELGAKTARLCEIACEGRPPVTFGDECYCADDLGGFGPPSGRCGGGR